ncbi:uncharacterized protein LOC106050120 [Biomphalaria glabrata]|uniref:Uncharacterized protein LOC106050120 n=1 Tax=Biomphalaria glabrata TaxID=6526 RepID=A0A9U8DTF5_BIOGL|nr:uncharacterized protein LOC106050120 [Biomphalaria glabrata]
MNPKLTVAILVLICSLADAKGRGGEGGRGRPGGGSGGDSADEDSGERGKDNRDFSDRYTWGVEVDAANVVQQLALVSINDSVVITRSAELQALNISRSTSVYDFSNSTSILAIGVENYCFLIQTRRSLDGIVDILKTLNNTNTSVNPASTLNGDTTPLTAAEVQELYASHRDVRQVCRRGRRNLVIRAEPTTDPQDNVIQVVSLTDLFQISRPTPPTRPPTTPRTTPPPAGRPGKGGPGGRDGPGGRGGRH